jgi:3-hydroxybutyryl-CoA dehydrogenase
MRPVHVTRDIPGFLANRMQHALMREALSLADRGIASAEDIDTAVQYGFGMRFLGAGPLLQKDIAGLDIHHAAATTIYPDLCNDTAPVPFIAERAARGDHGMKAGRGFYDWTCETIRATRARYETALTDALAVLRR